MIGGEYRGVDRRCLDGRRARFMAVGIGAGDRVSPADVPSWDSRWAGSTTLVRSRR